MMRRYITTLILLSFCWFIGMSFVQYKEKPQPKQALRKIVIDPGHGGSDGGAHGKYSNEKDIALAVSLKLEQMLHEEMSDVEIVMTRRTDVFDKVIEKANLANQARGDLFVCIHVNDASPIYHKV